MDFETLFAQTCRDLEKNCNVEETSNQFSTCVSNLQRVLFVSRLDVVTVKLKKLLLDLEAEILIDRKCRELAIKFRNEGNKWFQKKNSSQAIKCYNKSICFSPTHEGKELSLAFANRSAVFQDLEQWMYCLQDIELALETGYPVDLLYKLLERKGNCWFNLGEKALALSNFNKAKIALLSSSTDQLKMLKWLANLESKIQSLNDTQLPANVPSISVQLLEDIKNLRNIPPDINKESNPLLPCASSSVLMAFNDKQGRHLVATEDLEPGT